MPFDFAPSDDRALRGLTAYHDGLAAEEIVRDQYVGQGAQVLETRWRRDGAEIDLILQDADGVVFVEVKKAKTLAYAAERLSMRQLNRICLAAEAYCGARFPGELVNMRVDLALVDGTGAVEIRPNISIM
ncbi:MAG: YraN family protein [Silicimonas sp.]|nr:YraN family protein [Silicimonas sp.]